MLVTELASQLMKAMFNRLHNQERGARRSVLCPNLLAISSEG